VFTCPVLSFTPDAQTALQWFALTHDVEADASGRNRWRRIAWPAAGGAGDQDARLVQQLEVLRGTFNALSHERARQAQRDRELEAWRAEIARER
jgi:hypothetical protein